MRLTHAAFALFRRLIVAVTLALWLVGPLSLTQADASGSMPRGNVVTSVTQPAAGAVASCPSCQRNACQTGSGHMAQTGCLQFCFSHCNFASMPSVMFADSPARDTVAIAGVPSWRSISAEPAKPPPRTLS